MIVAVSGSIALASSDPDPSGGPAQTVPIKILKVWTGWSLFPSEGHVTIGVAFEDVSDKPATAVKLEIRYIDAFGSVLDTETVYANGTFSPNAVITPPGTRMSGSHSNIVEGSGSNDGTSAANLWNLLNAYGNKVDHYNVVVVAARFTDGTVWKSSAPEPGL